MGWNIRQVCADDYLVLMENEEHFELGPNSTVVAKIAERRKSTPPRTVAMAVQIGASCIGNDIPEVEG